MDVKVLLLCDDLFFTSRVQETARQVGVSVQVVREGLAEAVRSQRPKLILVDLDATRLEPIEEIRKVKEADDAPAVVGFVRHDEVERIRAARAAGANQVLARGAFSTKLPELLRGSADA